MKRKVCGKMKHYVLGFVFNKAKDRVLLVEKRKPKWQAGHWNGIGGKIEKSEIPLQSMTREAIEETSFSFTFEHCITFVCPGGTVFVFKAISPLETIQFKQVEDEELRTWPLYNLPTKMMANLKWMIPICLSTIQFPLLIQDRTLGIV